MNLRKLFTLASIFASVALLSCEKSQNDDNGATTFNLKTTEVQMNELGGDVEVEYTITNKTQGTVVLTNCKESWIQNISTATYGKIKFTVAPNYSDKEREATIFVEYTAIDKVYEIKVKQSASSTPMFSYTINTNEPTYISLNVTPADLTTAYLCRIYTEEHINTFELGTDEALAEYDMSVIEYDAYDSGQTLLNYLQNISHTGKAFDVEFTKLIPDTNYVVYSYHIDLKSGARTSGIYREVIHTSAPTMSDVNIDMTLEVEGAKITQTITPEDKEIYYYVGCWSVEDFYSYYGSSADMNTTFISKWNENITIQTGLGYLPSQLIEQNCKQGDQVIVYDNLKASTEYVFYVFAVDPDTAFAASEIILEKKFTDEAQASGMTIDITVTDIFKTTANVYWTASDPEGKFARSVFTKGDFDSWGTTDEEKFAYIAANYSFYEAVGSTDMNLANLTPNTTYVAFAYGLDGETPNTRIFTKEFTTKSDVVSSANVNLNWNNHYNMAALAEADAEHWGDYAGYENYALLPVSISGVTSSDDVYLMVTTLPLSYNHSDDEWIRDVVKEHNKINCYSNYNVVVEYEREYAILAVALDSNGNNGTLYKNTFYLYKSDSKPATEYTYVENK